MLLVRPLGPQVITARVLRSGEAIEQRLVIAVLQNARGRSLQIAALAELLPIVCMRCIEFVFIEVDAIFDIIRILLYREDAMV